VIVPLVSGSALWSAAKHSNQNNPILPTEWHQFRMVNSTSGTANPTGYLVTSMWFDEGASTCSDSPAMMYGFGFDSCMVGVDGSGNQIDYSVMYHISSQSSDYIQYTMLNYTSTDCSGSYTTVDSTRPTKCYNTGTEGFCYSYVASATPWAGQPPGLVVKDSTSADGCADGEFNRFSYITLHECFAVTSSDPGVVAQTFDNCKGGLFSYSVYSDVQCGTSISSRTVPLSSCYDNSDYYETMMCV
jgi:hypothetical protein